MLEVIPNNVCCQHKMFFVKLTKFPQTEVNYKNLLFYSFRENIPHKKCVTDLDDFNKDM